MMGIDFQTYMVSFYSNTFRLYFMLSSTSCTSVIDSSGSVSARFISGAKIKRIMDGFLQSTLEINPSKPSYNMNYLKFIVIQSSRSLVCITDILIWLQFHNVSFSGDIHKNIFFFFFYLNLPRLKSHVWLMDLGRSKVICI